MGSGAAQIGERAGRTPVAVAVADFRSSVVIMAVFALATNMLMLVMPLYMLQIYDRILPSQSNETLLYLSLIAGLALAILGMVEGVRVVLANRAATRFDLTMAEPAIAASFAQTSSGGGGPAKVQPVRDVATVRGALASRLVFNLLDLPFALLFIGVLYLIHPNLFWLALVGMAVLVSLALANELATRGMSKRQQGADMAAMVQLEHYARNAESVAAMGMLRDLVNQWGGRHAKALVEGDRAARVNAAFSGVSRTLRFSLQVAVLGYGALLVLAGEMTAGMIFAASIIAGRAFQPVDQAIAGWRNLSMARQAWQRIKQFLAEARTGEDARTLLPVPKGELKVSGVSVANAGDPARPAILSQIAFELEAGQLLGIVGPSGAGKSTLARVLTGVIVPARGEVTLDGHKLSQWRAEERGRFIGYLPQTVEMLPGTIAQNIARFRPDAEDGDVLAAAGLAHVEPLIQNQPDGYNTLIGPGGVPLSGGERQRIALARAFFGNPSFVVLDEPNANLDHDGEEALGRALETARTRGITVILITQRQRVLDHVDKIMVMEAGQVKRFDDAAAFRQPERNVATLKPAGVQDGKGQRGKRKSGEPGGSTFLHPMRASFDDAS